MSDDHAQLSEKLDRLEAAVAGLASSTLAIADRVELLRQEFSRSSLQIQRLGLNQESARAAAKRRDKSLAKISSDLDGIRRALQSRKS